MLEDLFLIIGACLLGLASVTTAQDDNYRLPPNYKVNHYDLDLVTSVQTFTNATNNYTGTVGIQFQVTVSTSEVKLHASPSYIELVTVTLLNNSIEVATLTSDDYTVNSTTNIVAFQFPSDLEVGVDYVLNITFNAQLSSSSYGFYKTSYTDDDGNVEYIAATQFESTYARYAFPCFDEPGYKATFDVNLTYPSDMNALSNTPTFSNITDLDTNLTTTVYLTSPKMPVYLLAFVISKYTCTEAALEGSAEYVQRICSRDDRASRRNFSLEITSLVIDNLNSYTGINYTESITKLDQVAVSGKSGAMENWGLVLYSEGGLLFDNTLQTVSNKQSILAVIAHELAHQWFGNYVTCKWWSEIFLNEGFATLYEYYIANAAMPVSEMDKQLVTLVINSVMTTDGNLNVQSLRANATTPSEISAKFSSLAYYKGSAVLRMAEHILGPENFRLGINKYLVDNAFEAVEPQDLWDALQGANANLVSVYPDSTNLSDVIENWIEKPGYPVINVSLVDSTIVMTQQRFLYSGTDDEDLTWYVPITYSTAAIGDYNENTSPRGWLTPTSNFTITDFTDSTDWIIVNNQHTGYYRVNYDETLWSNLNAALQQTNFSGIHVLNRFQVVQDSYSLGRAGLITFGQALKNTEFLKNEESHFPWYAGTNFYYYLLQRTGSISSLGAALTNHFLDLIATVTDSVLLTTVDEEEHVQTIKQIRINTYACKYGNQVCANGAKEVFANYKSTYEVPNINIRSIVYCNAIRYSDDPQSDWDFLFTQYQNSSVSSDSSAIWTALGCATNTTVLNSFVSRIFNADSVLTSSLYTSVFSTIYSANEVGVDFVLDYFINNYEAISTLFSEANLNASTILTGMASYFTRDDQITKLQAFIDSLEDQTASIIASANTAISTYTSNQAIILTHRSSLYSYFGISEEETTTTTTAATTTVPAATTATPAATTTTPAATTTTEIESTTASGTTVGPVGLALLLSFALFKLLMI